MASNPTSNFDFQNFYSGQLTADSTSGTLTFSLDTVPTPSEGILVVEPDSATNREIIYYTSKGVSTITCPSDGRGWDSTTPTAHLTGSVVIMAPVAYMLRMLKSGSLFDTTTSGWTTLGIIPAYSAINGNRSWTLSMGSDKTGVLSPGMRVKFDRTTPAPTQCTSLNGTTQFYSKTSPAGMTFTNNFVVSAWIKLSSYANATIASRYNNTSGWTFVVLSTGQVQLAGFNAGAANVSYVESYMSLPLNRWVHVTAQLDMATFTATPTTSYVMLDGVDVPAFVTRGGTNPTALIQAGNLEIGSQNGGTIPFPGKIAQVAIYSAKVTEANIRATLGQTLVGTETSLISAYTFNNSLSDLVVGNANTLTANGAAVATNADSPFAQGSTTGLTEYAMVMAVTASTLTIQMPEGSAFPSSGTMANAYYSPHRNPYGFPGQVSKWVIEASFRGTVPTSGSNAKAAWYKLTGSDIQMPAGEFSMEWAGLAISLNASAGSSVFKIQLDSGAPTYDRIGCMVNETKVTTDANFPAFVRSIPEMANNSSATTYALYGQTVNCTGATSTLSFDSQPATIRLTPTQL